MFAVAFGCLAGLIKITSFCVFLFAAFCIFVWEYYQKKEFSAARMKRFIFRDFILVGIPLLISLAWVQYADEQNMHNYYFYANTIFLSVLLGLVLLSIIEAAYLSNRIKAAMVVFPVLLILLIFSYLNVYFEKQKEGSNLDQLKIAKWINSHTEPNALPNLF